jgi:hypothetical protein
VQQSYREVLQVQYGVRAPTLYTRDTSPVPRDDCAQTMHCSHLDRVFTKFVITNFYRAISVFVTIARRPAFVPSHMNGRSFVLRMYRRYRAFDP